MYLVNNEPNQFKGYCTDVWFEEACKFILQNKEKPFFIYLPTHAPHAPLIVEEKYTRSYEDLEGKKIPSADYYGMIANIDENFGRIDSLLKTSGLAENTILIFCTGNGTQFGYSENEKLGWNKGYRGNKGDKEEGGHRVPFFIRWPKAGIQGGKDINVLTSHIDLLPTLATLCGLNIPSASKLDGIDFSKLLTEKDANIDDRTLFIHHRQDWRPPEDVEQSCIMKNQWRLINGTELYNVEKDQKYGVYYIYAEKLD